METEKFRIIRERSIHRGWLWTIYCTDWEGREPSYAVVESPTEEALRTAIEQVINAHTDQDILSSLTWCDLPVWLSVENQINFKAAHDLARQVEGFLPVTIKLGQHPDGSPAYHTFTTPSELTDFYLACVTHVQRLTTLGWQRKDSIDYAALASIAPPMPQ